MGLLTSSLITLMAMFTAPEGMLKNCGMFMQLKICGTKLLTVMFKAVEVKSFQYELYVAPTGTNDLVINTTGRHVNFKKLEDMTRLGTRFRKYLCINRLG